jgi:hypothetical protein
VHWGRYRAELRERLASGPPRRSARPAWWPVPVALSAALASVLVLLAFDPPRATRVADLAALEEAAIGGQLDLLRDYAIVERLDLLEDLELIRDLDRLDGVRES